MAEWTDPGGEVASPRYIAPLHVHRDDDEAWYVLSGELVVRAGAREYRIGPGGAALVPRGVQHTYWNPTASPASYLLVMTDRIFALIEALHALQQPDETEIAGVFSRHNSTYLGWP